MQKTASTLAKQAISIYGARKIRAKRHWVYKRTVTAHYKGRIIKRKLRTPKKWYLRREPRARKTANCRFTFYGQESTLFKAEQIVKEEGLVPKKTGKNHYYQDNIDAEKFISDKEYRNEIAGKGTWDEQDILES